MQLTTMSDHGPQCETRTRFTKYDGSLLVVHFIERFGRAHSMSLERRRGAEGRSIGGGEMFANLLHYTYLMITCTYLR